MDTDASSESLFGCPMCDELFVEPVSIPCGHTFCENCLSTFWEWSYKAEGYTCPFCGDLFNPKPHTYRNVVAAEAVELLKNTRLRCEEEERLTAAEDVACDVCPGARYKAVQSCVTCLASYCGTHIRPHLESEALRTHKLTEPIQNLQWRVCEQHRKPLELFCRTDSKYICALCVVSGHQGHTLKIAVEDRPVANTQAASQKRNHSGKQKQTSSSRPKKHLKQNEQDFTSESESWSTTHDYFSFSSPGSLEDLDLAVNSSHSGHPTRKKPDVLDSSSHAVKSKPQKPVKKNPGGSKKLSQSEVYDLISSRNELPIICKGKTGVLHKDKLATKGEPSIYFQGGWLFPGEFEILSGNAAAKHWKKSICLNVMELNKQFKALLSDSSACFPRITLFTLIEENKLKCELQEVRKELLESCLPNNTPGNAKGRSLVKCRKRQKVNGRK
ncbi:tripartite motif-containing protein 5-like [Polypterus senegalus]|uniref:tripartite motif-containing protein 5-like n=1 Tax=Polypterus senegalus TaxID=55291 RepID=UPI001962C945|nr:tripartite motif-containing protein 5-like [Polypterus senegalus]